MDWIALLRQFDGKHTDVLERLAGELPRGEESLRRLLVAVECDEVPVQVAATWLLKRWHDEGEPCVADATGELCRLLRGATHWEVRLHLLQLLSTATVPPRSRATLKKTLLPLTADDNKLVRAWAYSALAQLADQQPRFQTEVRTLLEAAGEDEAASVRARIRQVRKRMKWTDVTLD